MRWRKVEREPSLTILLCKVISKRKHYLHTGVGTIMETKLERIPQLSRENPEMVFTSIGHLVNEEMLKEFHMEMEEGKAVGIDGITKEEYGKNLKENLKNLVSRIKRKAYRSKPARRVEIPKENGKMRQLSIYCYGDRLVQEALKRVIEGGFEPHFYDEMMGFRPNRNCHMAIKKLGVMIEKHYPNYILDADIKGFFDNIDHEWAVKFVESKIKDPNIIRLVRRMPKSGMMKDYQYEETESGSGQDPVCPPIIANIYMHYVLVWWFKEKVQPLLKGYAGLVVYADDFVMCFQNKKEAEMVYGLLKRRMGKFGMRLEENKTGLIEFGRFAEENCKRRGTRPKTFTFLGFTHYCSKSRSGKFRVKRKTSRKKFAKKCKEIGETIKRMRTSRPEVIIGKPNQILVGYYHFYGITDNIKSLTNFKYEVTKRLFYWLNRRSQRKSYTWEEFNNMLTVYPLAAPKIYVNVYA